MSTLSDSNLANPAPTVLRGAATVAAIYESFGRGDIPAILALMDEDVSWDADWEDNHAQRAGLEYLVPRRGRGGVAEFFRVLSGFTFHDFRVLDVLSSDEKVVAQVVVEFSTPSGSRVRDEELHLWTVGADGRVVAFRHYVDTAKHIGAAQDLRRPSSSR